MVSVTAKAPRRERRSNEDRSAETQGRLIDATIECLNRLGYAGTTTILVSETSGVTRGGMLHHYPSKVDLMIATAEYCIARMRDERAAMRQSQPQNNAVMAVERGRYGIALTEIMIGSRSDAALAERFKPVAEMMIDRQRQAAAFIAQREGLNDADEVEVMVWLNMATIRGITLMELAGVDPGLTDRALQLMSRNGARLIEKLKAKQRGE